jgi:hypothetical protein
VVIHDLDIVCVATSPSETDSPLVVDSDAVLTLSATHQPFQSIPRWNPQIFYRLCRIQHYELSESGLLNALGEPA